VTPVDPADFAQWWAAEGAARYAAWLALRDGSPVALPAVLPMPARPNPYAPAPVARGGMLRVYCPPGD
jgi:hypothetical protein